MHGDDAFWLGRLRAAIRDEGLVLFAQPIVDLASGVTVQHELLIRMRGPDDELIPPLRFLPTAERFGLIAEIDRWVVRQAVGFAARGHAVQVNVSAVTLMDPDFGATIEREVLGAGARAGLLTFELTETALIQNEAMAAAFFERVRSLGCGVALDDFGTGHCGLRYLKRFRVDSLKIDRGFVADLLTDVANEWVLAAMVQLARGFGLQTVAEGVEDGATLERLRFLGVDRVQGFYLGRPAPANEVLCQAAALQTGARL